MRLCFRCNGTGKVGRDDPRHPPLTCPRCDGRGIEGRSKDDGTSE